MERRWRKGKGYPCNEHFNNAIKKYGWDGFEHIILEENLTRSQADLYEKMYIKEFNSADPHYGYNKTYGGSSEIPTEETRQKMRENHADLSGEKSPMYGKNIKDFMTPEKYQQWRNNLKKYAQAHQRGNNACAQPVYCYEKDIVYSCLADAAEENNISISDISSCINGYHKSAGFDSTLQKYLHWCRAEEKDSYIPPDQDESIQIGKFHYASKLIYCPELNESFYGTGEVERKYGISHLHILECCNHKRKSAGKHPITNEFLHWCYDDEKSDFTPPNEKESRNMGKYHHSAKAVYCIELDEIFDTAVEAHKKYGFSKQHIGAVCRGRRNYTGLHPQTKEKLHWMFLTDAIEQKKISKDKIQEYELK